MILLISSLLIHTHPSHPKEDLSTEVVQQKPLGGFLTLLNIWQPLKSSTQPQLC